jgi:hypothetical protein
MSANLLSANGHRHCRSAIYPTLEHRVQSLQEPLVLFNGADRHANPSASELADYHTKVKERLEGVVVDAVRMQIDKVRLRRDKFNLSLS